MGLFKRGSQERENTPQPSTSTQDDEAVRRKRKKSILNYVIPKSRVSEATLQVFRQLPGEIRHDPSMINFQREAERWKGNENSTHVLMNKASAPQLAFCCLICGVVRVIHADELIRIIFFNCVMKRSTQTLPRYAQASAMRSKWSITIRTRMSDTPTMRGIPMRSRTMCSSSR
jgi:hypothetical protein